MSLACVSVDSLRHTHAFSRVTVREFQIKTNTYVTISYIELYVGIGGILAHFQH